jgi:glycosyltransferase involved in cell wall biosynthesis
VLGRGAVGGDPTMSRDEAPTVGVVLATFNGEKFLPDLLASLRNQNRPPDVIVIADDGSTDATIRIVEKFSHSTETRMKLLAPERRLGAAGNFWRALRVVDADFVALADQDDVWYPSKLARLTQRLCESERTALVFHDADLIDEQGHRLSGSLWESLWPRGNATQVAFDELLRINVVTGSTMMFRRSAFLGLIERGLGSPPTKWHHDEWLTLAFALADDEIIAEPVRLAAYRRHADQVVGARGSTLERMVKFDTSRHLKWLTARADGLKILETTFFRQELIDARQHLQQRTATISRGLAGVPALVRGAGMLSSASYRQYAAHRFARPQDVIAALRYARR